MAKKKKAAKKKASKKAKVCVVCGQIISRCKC